MICNASNMWKIDQPRGKSRGFFKLKVWVKFVVKTHHSRVLGLSVWPASGFRSALLFPACLWDVHSIAQAIIIVDFLQRASPPIGG